MKELQPEKREHIMDVAEKLFAENGYDAASTRKIASEANVNSAMIAYYFGSKEELYKSIILRRIISLKSDKNITENKETSVLDKILYIADLYVEIFFNNRTFHKIMFREMGMTRKSEVMSIVKDRWRNNFGLIIDLIEKGIKKKEIKKVDPELFVMTLMAIPRTYVLSEVLVADIMKTKSIDAVYSKDMRERLKTYMNNLIKAMLEK
ncbi:MAG: helix-turn-helix domain-containing protein [Chitinophagales bacterium]